LRKLVLIVAVLTAAVAIVATPASAVLYGSPDGNNHPYVGIVRFFDADGDYMWRCSGTLIAPKVFLTAGHCVFGTTSAEVWLSETAPSTAEVLSGNYSHGITGRPYPNPGYDDFATFPNTSDVGIVVLSSRVRQSSYGQLPAANQVYTLYKHTVFDIVGYGVQDVKPVQIANVQRIAGQAMLVNATSGYSGGFNLHMSSNNGSPHQGGTCFGDSGGPVLYGSTVMAVNSFVINGNCAGAGYSYRIDQPNILSWIRSFL
jgi:secreted trypsin-like serine protease